MKLKAHYCLITIGLFISMIILFYGIINNNEIFINLSVSLLGILFMILIGFITFSMMKNSTRETVNSIFKSSKEQINKSNEISQELKETNKKLEDNVKELSDVNINLNHLHERLQGVYECMLILSNEVLRKPKLTVEFDEKSKVINAGEIRDDFTIIISNSGNRVAENVEVHLEFPEGFTLNPRVGSFVIALPIMNGTIHYYEEERNILMNFEALGLNTQTEREINIGAPKIPGDYIINVKISCLNYDWLDYKISIKVS